MRYFVVLHVLLDLVIVSGANSWVGGWEVWYFIPVDVGRVVSENYVSGELDKHRTVVAGKEFSMAIVSTFQVCVVDVGPDAVDWDVICIPVVGSW